MDRAGTSEKMVGTERIDVSRDQRVAGEIALPHMAQRQGIMILLQVDLGHERLSVLFSQIVPRYERYSYEQLFSAMSFENGIFPVYAPPSPRRMS